MGTDELSIWMTDGLGKEFRCCFIIITSFNLFKFEGNAKNCQHSSQGQGQGLDLRGQGHRSQGQGHKIWPRGASRPRPGLQDYITENEAGTRSSFVARSL